MSLLQVFDPGTEQFIPFAKNKLRLWHDEMKRTGVHTLARTIKVDDGSTIFINSLFVNGIFQDKIRITGGVSAGWVEQYPEQDLWSIPSAVLPSVGTAQPWSPVIQHITYSYIAADPRLNEAKQQLVICRYCRRVAEYTWQETRQYGTNLELLGANLVSHTNHSVMIYYTNPAITYTLIGEFVPGSGAIDPGVPGRQIPVMIKRSDTVYTITTAEYDGIPDGNGGFSGGASYGRLVSRDDAQGIVHIMPLKEGVTYAPVSLQRNVIHLGEYHSNDTTSVVLYDYNDAGTRTTRTIIHGLIAMAEVNPWGVLPDLLGPIPEDVQGQPSNEPARVIWRVANIARAKKVWNFIQSEMDKKRFGPDMDLAELQPHSSYQFGKVLVFPVKHQATFGVGVSGAESTYVWNSSYRQFSNITVFGVQLSNPVADHGPLPLWSYTLESPYVLTMDAVTRQFALVMKLENGVLVPDRPAFVSGYFSLGFDLPTLNGRSPGTVAAGSNFSRSYFALYYANGAVAKATFTSGLGQYTQAVNDIQMKNACLGVEITGPHNSVLSLAYAAYSALFAPTRGAYYRRSLHTHTLPVDGSTGTGPYSVVQYQIDNTDTDSLAPV